MIEPSNTRIILIHPFFPVRTLAASLAALLAALPASATHFEIELISGEVFIAVWDGAVDVNVNVSGGGNTVTLGESEDFSFGTISDPGEVTTLLEAPENFDMGFESDGGEEEPGSQLTTNQSRRLDAGDHALISQIGKVLKATRDIEDAAPEVSGEDVGNRNLVSEGTPTQTPTVTPLTPTQVTGDDRPDFALNSNAKRITQNLGEEIIRRSIRPVSGTTDLSMDDYISAARNQLNAAEGDPSAMPSTSVLRSVVDQACKALASCEETVSKISATNTAMARATDNKASAIVTERLGANQTPTSLEQNIKLQNSLVNVSASLRDTQIRESVDILNQAVSSLTNTVVEQATSEEEVSEAFDTISRVVSKTSEDLEQSKASLDTLVEKTSEIISQSTVSSDTNSEGTPDTDTQDTISSDGGVRIQNPTPIKSITPINRVDQMFQGATVSLARTGVKSVAQILEKNSTAATMALSGSGSSKIQETVSTMTRKLVINNFDNEDRLVIDNKSFTFTDISENETRLLRDVGIMISFDGNGFVPASASPN